jgi:DNA-binding NtrC family response regulator
METILLVENASRDQHAMTVALMARGYTVLTASDGSTARKLLERAPNLVMVDMRLSGNNVRELLQAVRSLPLETPVIALATSATVAAGIEALKHGAFAYLTTPVHSEELALTLQRAIEWAQLQREVRRLRQLVFERRPLSNLVGNSAPMRRVFEQLEQLAARPGPVLISGESGTGKELAARTLHQLSPAHKGPFVVLNVAGVPRDRVARELFGHTGDGAAAEGNGRAGKLALAQGGVLLLNEVGGLASAVQDQLFKTLTAPTIHPAGNGQEQAIDVRLIATTSCDLRRLAKEGRFCQELYCQFEAAHIELPPLRERREDVPLLTAAFLQRLAEERARRLPRVSAPALDALQRYGWPGNVRQLRTVLESVLAQAPGDVIELDDLPLPIQQCGEADQAPCFRHGMKLEELEREVIQHCLLCNAGSRQRTADLLGISTRTLLRKIQEYRLEDPLRLPKASRMLGVTLLQ